MLEKDWPLADKGNLEQLLNDTSEDQEKQRQQERGSKGPGGVHTTRTMKRVPETW